MLTSSRGRSASFLLTFLCAVSGPGSAQYSMYEHAYHRPQNYIPGMIPENFMTSTSTSTTTSTTTTTESSETQPEDVNPEEAEELLNEIVNFGLDQSNRLENVRERELYEEGVSLKKSNPAHFVGVFNKQKDRAKELSKFGYASLQASSLLARQ